MFPLLCAFISRHRFLYEVQVYLSMKFRRVTLLGFRFAYISPNCRPLFKKGIEGFPSGSVKNLPASAGDTGWIPGPERSDMPQSS